MSSKEETGQISGDDLSRDKFMRSLVLEKVVRSLNEPIDLYHNSAKDGIMKIVSEESSRTAILMEIHAGHNRKGFFIETQPASNTKGHRNQYRCIERLWNLEVQSRIQRVELNSFKVVYVRSPTKCVEYIVSDHLAKMAQPP